MYNSPERPTLPPTSNLYAELVATSLPMATFEYEAIPLTLEDQLEALNIDPSLYKSPEIFILPATSNLYAELVSTSLPMATFEYDVIPLTLEFQLDALNFSAPLNKSPPKLIFPLTSMLPSVFTENISTSGSLSFKALIIFLDSPICLTVNAVLI